MTPKKKAIKLCQLFGSTTIFSDDNNGYSLSIDVAKKCALICVDEILVAVDGKYDEYWNEVKAEIEKL